MFKKTVKYSDFDNNERTEDLYFNLTQSELVEIALNLPDGLSETNITQVNEQSATQILEKLGGDGIFKFVKELMLKAYGIKSEDGRRFEKSEQISTEFSQTMAFDTMFMELMSNDLAAAEFVNAIIPKEMADNVNKQIATKQEN